MTSNRHKCRAIVTAVVAAVFILPASALAQTAQTQAPGATAPSSTVPPAVTTPATDPIPAPTAGASAVDSPAAATAGHSPDIALKLPRDLSPWGMFMAADIIVKAVMVG